LETWESSQHSLIDTGKPRKTCVEVAGRRNDSDSDDDDDDDDD
jgi:hypothetical protein